MNLWIKSTIDNITIKTRSLFSSLRLSSQLFQLCSKLNELFYSLLFTFTFSTHFVHC